MASVYAVAAVLDDVRAVAMASLMSAKEVASKAMFFALCAEAAAEVAVALATDILVISVRMVCNGMAPDTSDAAFSALYAALTASASEVACVAAVCVAVFSVVAVFTKVVAVVISSATVSFAFSATALANAAVEAVAPLSAVVAAISLMVLALSAVSTVAVDANALAFSVMITWAAARTSTFSVVIRSV